MGPGRIAEVKSDSVYVVKSRREQKVMHHDKLKLCDSGEFPKWLVEYQRCGGPKANLPSSDDGEGSSADEKYEGGMNTRDGDVSSPLQPGPHMGTRSRSKRTPPSRPVNLHARLSKAKAAKQYCVCKQKTILRE